MDRKKKYIIAITIALFFVMWDIINTGGVSSNYSNNGLFDASYRANRLYNSLSDHSSTIAFDRSIESFMKKWKLKGASVAVLKDEKLVYSKGYGWADKEAKLKVEPYHQFRIASVSKLITAVAIMKLVENAQISLYDKVFGKEGILNDSIYLNYTDKRFEQITIYQLLTHTAGWRTKWGDQMFIPHSIARQMNVDLPVELPTIIEFALSKKLHFTPGRRYSYSNLGYAILGELVSKVSGYTYEDYVQSNILTPLGIYDMQIGNNLYEEKALLEVKYYEQGPNSKAYSIYDKKKIVPKVYGGNDINTLGAAGGWITSSSSLARLLVSINNEPGVPDILLPETIELMTKPMNYGEGPLGWIGTYNNIWWRSGTLTGTSAFVFKGNNGFSYVFITNTSTWKGPDFSRYINRMMGRAINKVENWPEEDLFNHYETQPLSLNNL